MTTIKLDSSTRSTILSDKLFNKLSTKSTNTVRSKTKGGKFMTKYTSKTKFKITELDPHNSVTWKLLVCDFGSEKTYSIILGRYILKELKFNFKLARIIIEGGCNGT